MKLTLLAVTVFSVTSAKPRFKPVQALFGNVKDLVNTVQEVTKIDDIGKDIKDLFHNYTEWKLTETISWEDREEASEAHPVIDFVADWQVLYQENIAPVLKEIGQEIEDGLEAKPLTGQIEGILGDIEESMDDYLSNMNKCNLPGIKHFLSHTFTNCGSTGPEGPSHKQCMLEYAKPLRCHWTNSLFYVNEGYQEWTVETTGIYQITASGAMGGFTEAPGSGFCSGIRFDEPICKDTNPEKGATITAEFKLQRGDRYFIAVGQMGMNGENGGGGGGGTFVVKKPSKHDYPGYPDVEESDFLIVAAGGAGGSCNPNYGIRCNDGTGVTRAIGGGFRRNVEFQLKHTGECDGGQGFKLGLNGGKHTQRCKTAGGFGGGAAQLTNEHMDYGNEVLMSGADETDSVFNSGDPDYYYYYHQESASYINSDRRSWLNTSTLNSRENHGHGSVTIKLIIQNK